MDGLVRIKEILQTQIEVTKDMFNQAIKKIYQLKKKTI